MKLQDIIDEIFEETTNEDLKNWFKQKWVNIGKKDKSGKHPPCGTSGKKKGYAKCVPASKAARMTPAQRKSAIRRKRAVKQGVGGKPTNVSTFAKKRRQKRAKKR